MSASVAASAAAALSRRRSSSAAVPTTQHRPIPLERGHDAHDALQRRDWDTFVRFLRSHHPPLSPTRFSGAHVLEFLDACPSRRAREGLVGRLRVAFVDHGGSPETNPFGLRAVRLYLRDSSKARP